MKQFKVQITKPASLIAFTTIRATSPLKAKAVVEYKASENPTDFDWSNGSAMKGSRIRVEILETEDVK